MKSRLAFGALSVALFACGDNSNECDPGTTRNENGVCVGTLECSEGTIAVDGKCEIDPNACQGGTVLVGGQCVDPGVAMPDIEEGAEPNGLGLFEQSSAPAGEITLKAEGEHFVIHGKIEPFRDADGDGQKDVDVDTYFVEVTAPTLLSVTADGTNGLAAGFVSVANVASTSPLTDWVRFGINLNGDTSKRQLYLPVAGTYLIGIGDTRTLILSGGAAGAGEGKPAFEYYVTIDKQAIPAPTPLTFTDGVATSSGNRAPGEVKLFSAAQMGLGVNSATLSSTTPQVQASVELLKTSGTTTKFLGVGDADNAAGDPAVVSAVGFRANDTALIVADSVLDYAASPSNYELEVVAGVAGALSTNGMDVTQPANTSDFSTFFYDVAPDGLLVGLDISFDTKVTGVVVDENFFIFSFFTFDPDFGFAFGDTFQSYRGLMRHATPGRYYFLTFDPTGAATELTVTSSYGPVATTPIIKGTPLTGTAINAYQSNAFTYSPGTATDPWQSFTASGTGTGTITVAYFNPATAVGRLDFLNSTCGAFCDDTAPAFTTSHTAAAPTKNRILLDQSAITSFLVTVNTATVAPPPTFDLTFAPTPNVNDLGSPAAGATVTALDKPLAGTGVQRYLVRAANGNRISLTATPDTGMDTAIRRINADESTIGTAVNNGAAGSADSTIAFQTPNGWSAYIVDKTGADGNVDVSLANLAPITYANTASTTAFADICASGSAVPMTADLDEGRSAIIAAPTGFQYFGLPAPSLRMFANGFLSFDTNVACAGAASCFFTNADIPLATGPNAVVAPYWDDLVLDSACQKVTGTKLTLQWVGELFDVAPVQTVQMQVILDGATNTVEFVYGPMHNATGSGATVGLENQVGLAAKKVLFNQAMASATTLFTPM